MHRSNPSIVQAMLQTRSGSCQQGKPEMQGKETNTRQHKLHMYAGSSTQRHNAWHDMLHVRNPGMLSCNRAARQTCQPLQVLSADAMLLVLEEGSKSSRLYSKPSLLRPSSTPVGDLPLRRDARLNRSMPMMVREWPSCWKYNGGLPAGG